MFDLAGLVGAARTAGLGEAYERALVAGYGTEDLDALSAQIRLHRLYGAVWRAHHPMPSRAWSGP